MWRPPFSKSAQSYALTKKIKYKARLLMLIRPALIAVIPAAVTSVLLPHALAT